MGLIQSISQVTKRLGLWILAAGITLAVLFTAVLFYKLTLFEPDPPTMAQCQSLQLISTTDGSAEIHLYQCQRGSDKSAWQGFEVWLFEPAVTDWLRIATAEQGECVSLAWLRPNQLMIYHGHSRGDINLAQSSVVYTDNNQRPNTISIKTERVDECPL